MEHVTKLVVLASTAAALFVAAVLNARGWPAAFPLTIGACVLMGAVSAWKAELAAALVLLFAFTFPVFVAIAPGPLGDAYTGIWMAALFGVIVPRSVAAGGWALPRPWALPLALWALTVALTWPVVALRQIDFVPAVIDLPKVGVSIRGLVPQAAIVWVVNVALTTVLGILWFDWLFVRRVDSPHGLERRLAPALVASWGIATAVALYQFFVDATYLNSGTFGFLRRASGTLRDANVFGVVAALCGPILVLLCQPLPRRFRYPLIGAGLLLSWVGVWASGSRTALAASAIALLFMAPGFREVAARVGSTARAVRTSRAALATAVVIGVGLLAIGWWTLRSGAGTLVATSGRIEVRSTEAPAAETPPASAPTGGSGTPGDAATARPSVTTDSPAALPNGIILVRVERSPGNPSDWTGLYLAGAPDDSYIAWKFLDGSMNVQAVPFTSATLEFAAPAAPGVYEVRLFEKPFGGPMDRLRSSLPAATVGSLTTFLYEMLWRRQDYGTVAVAMIREHPIVGVGVGAFHLLTADYGALIGYSGFLVPDNAQNWFRHQLAELGLLGSIGWIVWVVLFTGVLIRGRVAASNRFAAATLRGALVGLGLISLLGMPTQHVSVTLIFWTLAYWFTTIVDGPRAHVTSRFRQSLGWPLVIGVAVLCSAGTWYLAWHDLRIPYMARRIGWDHMYGLYGAETGADGRLFRWTMQRAVAVVPAPAPWMKLTVMVNHADLPARPVEAKVWRDGVLVFDQTLEQVAPATTYVRVPDGNTRVALDFWCSRVVRPRDYGVDDPRELGLQVSWEFVEAPPANAPVALRGMR